MNRLRWIGLVLGCLLASIVVAQTQRDADEQTLKNAKPPIPTDAKGLLEYFVSQSPKDGEAKHLESLVRQLGSNVHPIRTAAEKELIKRGPPALPYLRTALSNSPLEAKRRAEVCIERIEKTMEFGAVSAAARVLMAHKDQKAAEVLLNFLPMVAGDGLLEEELLGCVGQLTISKDKIDALLINALKDPSAYKRTAAAYLVGRRGGPEHRDQLRSMLGDGDLRVRRLVAEGLFGKRPPQTLADTVAGDEKLVADEKIKTAEADLLQFFRKRTLGPDEQKHLRDLVKKLGSNVFNIREPARKELVKRGIPALPFLREALAGSPLETKRRAEMCIAEIGAANNASLPIAAAHLLARPAPNKDSSPAELIRTLLAYVPFADDDSVEEEMLIVLTLLSLREPTIEPELLKALSDPIATRRAAAAYVVGHVGTTEQIAKVRPLLDDPHPVVRLRAAQGMLSARDVKAVPTFIDLLQSVPTSYLPLVDMALQRVADDKVPADALLGSADPVKASKAWKKWLDESKDKIDLTNLHDRESYLGLITICEYDNQVGNIQGQVWETARGGAKRWTFAGTGNNQLLGAMDAHSLPNGRVLVAENSRNRVTERDTKGEIKWEYNIPANPIACQRLPNGNTFIACYNMILEVKADKTEVYRMTQVTPGVPFHIFSAHKAKNGHIVMITSQGQIYEMEAPAAGVAAAKRVVTHISTTTLNNWCSVEMQPNGNFLAASMNNGNGNVRELDRKGTEIWSRPYAQAFRATKLPNGNVLVAGMNNREVVEMDRAGNIRWRAPTTGRPWSVHYR